MENICYFLGAGASANKIPMYQAIEGKPNFSKGFQSFWSRFSNLTIMEGSTPRDFNNFIIESSMHYTLDTFARKLYLINDPQKEWKLKLLKLLISNYLLNLQRKRNLDINFHDVDHRYDSFFAATLEQYSNSPPILPEGFHIVSWNYDNQVELSLSNYNHETKSLDGIYRQYGIYPRRDRYDKLLKEEIRIVKLNGHAGSIVSNKESNNAVNQIQVLRIEQDEGKQFESFKNELLDYYHSINITYEHMINFAFEDMRDLESSKSKEYAEHIFSKCTRFCNYWLLISYI